MTDRELAFCEFYACCRNAEQAALEAGYSRSSARKNAWKILRRGHVQEQLNVLAEKARDAASVRLADVIEEIAAIAFASPADYMERGCDGQWRFKEPGSLNTRERAALKDIRVIGREGGAEYKYFLNDKLRALNLLYQHFKNEPASRHEQNPFRDVPQEKLNDISRSIAEVLDMAK